MRLGGSVEKPYHNPEEWLALVRELGYSAVIAPVGPEASREERRAYLACAEENDLVIGEVGIWKNTLSPDGAERKAAVEYAKSQLSLAEELGARCCVNIAGARGEKWDGCYAENYGDDTYAMLVDTARVIIDGVKPTRTFFTLEPMPWMYPDSPEGYLKLLKDVDRPAFGVHLDYTNMLNSVEKYLNSASFIRHCFSLLGPHIKSVHAKDAVVDQSVLPCCIREVPPGQGTVDFALVLRLTQELGEDATLFVEHLTGFDAYKAAAAHVRGVAQQAGVPVK